MRHLFVTNDFPPKRGGIESYLLSLCSGFDPAHVTVVAPSRPGYKDVSLPYRVVWLPGNYLRGRTAAAGIIDVARGERPDVIHFLQVLPLGRLARRVGDATGTPVTVVVHGSELLVASKAPGVRGVLKRILEGADHVFAVSRFTAGAVTRVAPGAVVTVAPPPVDVNRFSPHVDGAQVRRRYAPDSDFVVLFVSRLVRRKGAAVLIEAMKQVDGTAIIAGSGPQAAALRKMAGPRVVFAGHVDDAQLPAFYAASDVFCMPCTDRYRGLDTEGYGIVYLEASSTGVACVAGACGGSVEAVADGETGIVLPRSTPQDCAGTLNVLAADGALRARLGAAGRRKVLAEHAPPVAAAAIESALSASAR